MSSYQLLPPLTAEEYAALKADIAARGVMVPVERDETGAILDGHHRAQIAAELGIEYPTIVRAGWTEEAKRDHVLKVNLLRRQLGPIAWADAFRRLAAERGLRLGSGRQKTAGEDHAKTAALSVFAVELGQSPRNARRWLDAADKLSGEPDLVLGVNEGIVPLARALREKRNRDAEDVRARQAAYRAAEAAGRPSDRTKWQRSYEQAEYHQDGGETIPILTDAERTLLAATGGYLGDIDLAVTENYSTRPLTWEGSTIQLPTGVWHIARVRFAGTTQDVARRWWEWDHIVGDQIARDADPAWIRIAELATPEATEWELPYRHVKRSDRHGYRLAEWAQTAGLIAALEKDLARARARIDQHPGVILDARVIWNIGRRVLPPWVLEGRPWSRFTGFVLSRDEDAPLVVEAARIAATMGGAAA